MFRRFEHFECLFTNAQIKYHYVKRLIGINNLANSPMWNINCRAHKGKIDTLKEIVSIHFDSLSNCIEHRNSCERKRETMKEELNDSLFLIIGLINVENIFAHTE